MSKQDGKKNIHSVGGDNVINFPKPSTPRSSRSIKDVESRTRLTINFEPDWDTDQDDPPDSSA